MGYVYMAPLLFGLLVLFIPNMISTVRFTLFDIELGTGSLRLEYIGAANYIRAFTADIRFKTYLVETIGSLVTQIPVIVIFSLFIAVVLNQKFRGRVVVRTIFFLPVILATAFCFRPKARWNLPAPPSAPVIPAHSRAGRTCWATSPPCFLPSALGRH